MPQIRVRKENSFCQISNRTLQDQTLSFKARGLLAYMLSLPQDWDYSLAGLAAKSDRDGISAVRSGIDELIQAKYIHRRQARSETGAFDGYEYIVFETPQEFAEEGEDAPSCGFPTTENPSSEKPSSENCTQQILNSTNTKRTNTPIVPREVLSRCEDYAGEDRELLEVILGLLENRAAIRKPVKTARAMNGILNQLDKHSGGDRAVKMVMLERATLSNWLTVYPLKADESPPGRDGGKPRQVVDEEGLPEW